MNQVGIQDYSKYPCITNNVQLGFRVFNAAHYALIIEGRHEAPKYVYTTGCKDSTTWSCYLAWTG
jgi:hypothetical protein